MHRGAIFYQSCLPTAEFGTLWPTDPSLEVYEEKATGLLKERTLAFLDRVA